jgi:hypothetical protein
VDAQSRNEMRHLIHGMLSDWVQADGGRDGSRTLVVFIDDLDRCSDDVIVGVCEAVKLYLDAPGLIFVLACDLSVLARGVSGSARGGQGEGRTYLEKIVQVAHRVPAPDRDRVAQLIQGYAERSSTGALIDETVSEVLIERTGRNPRRVKRIINSFVLAHHLNPRWQQPPLGSVPLITVILLQHLYSEFYDWLVSEEAGEDPLGDFLDYAYVRARGSNPPAPGDPWWSVATRVFRRYGLPAPDRSPDERQALPTELQHLDQLVPHAFPPLSRNEAFIAMLRGVGNRTTRRAVRSQLVSRPLGTDVL